MLGPRPNLNTIIIQTESYFVFFKRIIKRFWDFRLDCSNVDAGPKEFSGFAVDGDDGEVLVQSGVDELVEN